MAETDRMGSRTVRMTSEEIVQRGFASKVRGISESDVRSFLRRVADEVERLGKREDQLTAQIGELQTAFEEKPKASKSELLESLGEQTTRVLSSAEEAAEQMLTDARTESQATLASAKKEAEEMLSEARAQAEQTLADTGSRVRSLQESSQRDASTVIAEARTQGREIFQESVVVREQILKDLLRRRDLLLEQIDELRKGREELLESYKVVKGSFQKATDALHTVEEKASSELLTTPIDVDALLKAPVELPSILDANSPIPQNSSTPVEQETPSTAPQTTEESTPVKADDTESSESEADEEISLTGKRKGLKKYVKEALGVGPDGQPLAESSIVPIEQGSTSASGTVTTVPKKKDVGELFKSLKDQNDTEENSNESVIDLTQSEDVTEDKSSKKSSKKKSSAKKDPIAYRDEVLSEVTSTILRKAKRQLQDEQNELLESLRTIKAKKRVSSENILPDEQTQLKTWEEAIRSDLETVFAAGATTVSTENVTYDHDSLKSAVNWIIAPLRETLSSAIDEGEQADATARVGARYREWRNSDLKNSLYDALCSAFNSGVLAAAKSDATVTWNVEKVGQCPDCDDNALEPTAGGESFPTGQVAPPAHSGCRCVITVA